MGNWVLVTNYEKIDARCNKNVVIIYCTFAPIPKAKRKHHT
jgi:hypothetical protein